MEINLKTNIRSFLDSLEPLEPIPTELEPFYLADSGIKAVIFDIYGTLLISSSGDIDQANLQQDNVKQALDAAGYSLHPQANANDVYNYFLSRLPQLVEKHQEVLREKGHPYPDIDIVAVWQELINEAVSQQMLSSADGALLDMIIVFEILSNRVYPMPGMIETLQYLRDKQIPIGIVSNAQYYTPIIINYFIDGKLHFSQQVSGFEAELSAFSYKELRAKPDVKLFDILIPQMRRLYGILPGEAVFVGNDMLKDVYTANKATLKTILFAGDKRSLRLREDDDRTRDLRPDYVITDLRQLKEIIV